MTLEERIDQAETRVCTTVFPFLTNHHDTLFGGKAMAIMDEVSFMAATRFCRKRLVTVSSDKINFEKAIPSGSIIEAIARVESVGRTSLKVKVEIYLEHMYEDGRELAIQGMFTFVALDDEKKPIPVLEGLDVTA
ncbi:MULTISPECIES: acyl-CoA thioesterase [Sphingobacterium]|jgi:acyl-CoA hydrolase|uniref:Acyl-CoA thioesterase n=1 Tax=Sphingobacterium litopenaei TaxID=2763500 RepID=A0ABR7YE79_9SPHI|nr:MULTISPECIES: acyl-CoA thioesterase [Sphingobacterium]MBD1429589.1 acyl-CoA thioesterase [Sphingobacterium litopenaei]NGM74027.1 acyl-CoA thioesterase [Sphingobacterium sp. SGL-16]